MEKTFIQGALKECCLEKDNLEQQPSNKPEMIIKKCKVCGANHYRLLAKDALFMGKDR